jgi:3-deoxy-manno-octulosonate cytidylyltransferase (CMP-KDO synthetase)
MTAIVIIPARYDSTRFPGKPLYPLRGIPLIQHVYENSKQSRLASNVIIATDNELIYERVFAFGGNAIMTDKKHPSGTDRIAEVASSLECDIIVNVQGDEPLIRPEMIDDVITILDDSKASMGTLIKKIHDPNEIFDPNTVKVVFDKNSFALYFSRAPIPFHRDTWKITDMGLENQDLKERSQSEVYKHIGIYSYFREALIEFAQMEPSGLEKIERLEQLRALENGMKIKVKETLHETFGVDTPEDLARIERCLSISL